MATFKCTFSVQLVDNLNILYNLRIVEKTLSKDIIWVRFFILNFVF